MKPNKQDRSKIEKKIDGLIKENRFDTIIIIVLMLILIFILAYVGLKMGKIGYYYVSSDNVEEYEEIQIINITENDINTSKLNDLNIFANSKYGGEKLISPESSGKYKFCVRNESRGDIKYSINFSDYMTNPINMKYKLKIDNIYVRGNEQTYVNVEDLNINDIIVLEDSNKMFTLEWYWEDDGRADAFITDYEKYDYYQLKLNINSETIENASRN